MLKSNNRRNIFILLNLLCLILIIFLHASIPQEPGKYQQFTIAFNKDKIANSPYLFLIGIFAAGYLIIIFLGLFNLTGFIIRNLKKPLFAFTKQNEPLPLSQEESSQLIFFTLFLVLLIYFSQWLIIIFKLKINHISAIIFSNLIVEVSVILLIVKYLKAGYLDFKLNVNRAAGAAKKYLTILPVLIGIIFLNNFVLEKFGIKNTISPAIELFLKIKGAFLLSLFMIQIIFLGPLAEELFFRGFVYKLLRGKYGFLFSAVSSSLLFAALHRSIQDALPLSVLAIIFCYVYEKTNNIASPIFFHIIHNSLSVSFLLLAKAFV